MSVSSKSEERSQDPERDDEYSSLLIPEGVVKGFRWSMCGWVDGLGVYQFIVFSLRIGAEIAAGITCRLCVICEGPATAAPPYPYP